jgi:hypothetical protein
MQALIAQIDRQRRVENDLQETLTKYKTNRSRERSENMIVGHNLCKQGRALAQARDPELEYRRRRKSLQPSSPTSQTPNGSNRTVLPHMAQWEGKRKCP